MRIMHILSSAVSGGAEVYVRDMALEMVKLNHDVFILFIDRAEESGRSLDFEREFIKILDDNGVSYNFIGQCARKNPLKGMLLVRKAFNKWQPDIVHAHLYYGAIFSLSLPHCKVLYTHHNIILRAPKYIYKLLDIRISYYVGICKACTELLTTVTQKKVCRIDNGVPGTRIKVKNNYENNNTVILIFVGRLSEQKNLHLLISSLYKLPDLDFHLLIAGEGDKREELERLALKFGLKEKITFLGNVSNIKDLLHASDIFVMSSAWEGLPIAQIEATMTGLPVIVTNVGGCAEIVEHVKNGIVVNIDVDEYSAALRRLIEDYSYRYTLHQNALKWSNRYDISSSVDAHLKVYQSLLNKKEK